MKKRGPVAAATEFNQQSDRDLVEACLAGNARAWEALLARYERLIYSIPIRLGIPHHEAEEIFQSVSLILFRKLATLRAHERIISWLTTTTRRECWRFGVLKNRHRREPGNELADHAPQEPSAEQVAYERRVADQRQEILWQALSELPDRCRDLLMLLFYLDEELTYEDIAEQMNMPESSIGPTRGRCLQKLKKILQGRI
jgi:RNA polymerase sigma factor (sigma-70 family)